MLKYNFTSYCDFIARLSNVEENHFNPSIDLFTIKGHVLKPETTKRNETTEKKPPKQAKRPKQKRDTTNTIRNDQNNTTGQQKTELSYIYDFEH